MSYLTSPSRRQDSIIIASHPVPLCEVVPAHAGVPNRVPIIITVQVIRFIGNPTISLQPSRQVPTMLATFLVRDDAASLQSKQRRPSGRNYLHRCAVQLVGTELAQYAAPIRPL